MPLGWELPKWGGTLERKALTCVVLPDSFLHRKAVGADSAWSSRRLLRLFYHDVCLREIFTG